eukprot:TRINITY_DN29776_c0_g1_i1.p1 TRINITY_DN29776_c0_g1~~TRINITY_DN29776_c0_g1_i1.p1  ORF type:complete len:326 (+),score=46.78 TRINITY_DN29776_c0_g1_i1:70-1047(+)
MFVTQHSCFVKQPKFFGKKQRNKLVCLCQVSKRQLGLSSVVLLGGFVFTPFQTCAEYLRSKISKQPGVLTIKNDTSDVLKAYWVNYDGDLEYYSSISPGQEWTVDTFESHPWRIVDETKDGALVREYIAQPGEQFVRIDSIEDNPLVSQNGSSMRSVEEFEGFDGLGGAENDYARAKVGTVQMDVSGGVVLLQIDGEDSTLPVYIGFLEASSLLFASGMETRRPVTINTWMKTLKLTGAQVQRMLITRLVGDTYYARIVLQLSNGEMRCVDSRPSDGMAVALATNTPVFVARSVLDEKLNHKMNENQMQGPGKKQVIIPLEGKEA